MKTKRSLNEVGQLPAPPTILHPPSSINTTATRRPKPFALLALLQCFMVRMPQLAANNHVQFTSFLSVHRHHLLSISLSLFTILSVHLVFDRNNN